MNPVKTLLTDVLGRRKDNFDWRVAQDPLDLTQVKSVCVLHLNDKLGDAIIISLLVDALAKARPGLPIFVGSLPSFGEYWSSHPSIAEAIPLEVLDGRSNLIRTLRWASRGKALRGRFDAVVSFQPYPKPDHFAFLRSMRARTVVGFNKNQYRLFDYSLDERRHGVYASPIATRAASVMKAFGHEVDVRSLLPHLPFGPEDESVARRIVSSLPHPGRRVLFNVYGAGEEKRLSPSSVRRAVAEIRSAGHAGPIFVSVPGGLEGVYEDALKDECLRGPVEVVGPWSEFSHLFAFVSLMNAVISPDTAVGHIAAALEKPQVCLFARRGNVPTVWKPLSDRCLSVVSTTGTNVNDVDWCEIRQSVACALMDAD